MKCSLVTRPNDQYISPPVGKQLAGFSVGFIFGDEGRWKNGTHFQVSKPGFQLELCYNYNLLYLQLECVGWVKIQYSPVESPFDGFSDLPKYLGRPHFHKYGQFFFLFYFSNFQASNPRSLRISAFNQQYIFSAVFLLLERFHTVSFRCCSNT